MNGSPLGISVIGSASGDGGGGEFLAPVQHNVLTNIVLGPTDFNRSHYVMNTENVTFTLPAISASELGYRIYFFKRGTGQVLWNVEDPTPDTGDIIKTPWGETGTALSNQTEETNASITLEVTGASEWSILGYPNGTFGVA